jgi:capsular polysaccharide biosynthesis protein
MNKLNLFMIASMLATASLIAGTFASSSTIFASTEEPTEDDQNSEGISSNNQTNTEQSTLEIIDGFLEDCIEELENGNTDEALENCQSADEELDRLLENNTGQ